MGFIYKYIDMNDEIVKYIGIVWSTDNIYGLKKRVKEHLRDSWNKLGDWRIEYINENICSRTDAEYFESHYISLYNTGKYFNKSKVGWGVSNFLPQRDDWNVLDLSFLNNHSLKKQEEPVYITRYDVISKSIYKRKSNQYYINESGINLLINDVMVTINNDFYYDDSGFLYFISNNGFKEKEIMQDQSRKYTVDTNNKGLFTKYVYYLIGGGDERILQAEYGYI